MRESMDHLIPECYGDTLLVDMLVRHEPNHQKGISSVLKTMESKFKNREAIGIIDDDKVKYTYYDKFTVKVKENEYYRHLSHPNKKHHLIVLKKDFEEFIIRSSKLVPVKDKYKKYLKDADTLKQYTKLENINDDVKDLFNMLIQKKAAPLMEIQKILRSHIS